MDALEDRVATLVATGLTDLDIDLVMFATRTYDLFKSKDLAVPAECIQLKNHKSAR